METTGIIALMTHLIFFTVFVVTSSNALAPPQRFAIEPVDKTAIVSDTILLACRVVNKIGTLQWTRDSFGLGTTRDLIGYPRYTMTGHDEEGDYSLQIRNVSLEDEAKYQCQVGAAEGVRGIRSRDAQLTVYVPPDPPTIVEGDFLKTTSGTQVVLTCEAMNGKPASELTWLDPEGNAVPAEEVSYTTQVCSDGKRANAFLKWTFQASKDHHGKTFSCRSENPAVKNPQSASIKLDVKYPPDVGLVVDKEYVYEGDDVKFTCNASANPSAVVYKWYKNDEVVLGDHTTSYWIRKVSKEHDSVVITCEVLNAIGVAKASHVLRLSSPPVFKEEPQTERVDVLNDKGEQQTATLQIFPVNLVVTVIISSVVGFVAVTIIVVLCMKRKDGFNGEMSDLEKPDCVSNGGSTPGVTHVSKVHHNHLHPGDTGSSGTGSDVKVEIRTSSSLSGQREWVDGNHERTVTANEIAQVVENIYNYTQQQHQLQEPVYSTSTKMVCLKSE